MAEITDARSKLQAELAEARAELAEAQAEMATGSSALAAAPPLPAAPPADVVIHDITDDDVPSHFNQAVMLVSFESLPGTPSVIRLEQRRRKLTVMRSPWLGRTCAPT
jgi:hypothetical protein